MPSGRCPTLNKLNAIFGVSCLIMSCKDFGFNFIFYPMGPFHIHYSFWFCVFMGSLGVQMNVSLYLYLWPVAFLGLVCLFCQILISLFLFYLFFIYCLLDAFPPNPGRKEKRRWIQMGDGDKL